MAVNIYVFCGLKLTHTFYLSTSQRDCTIISNVSLCNCFITECLHLLLMLRIAGRIHYNLASESVRYGYSKTNGRPVSGFFSNRASDGTPREPQGGARESSKSSEKNYVKKKQKKQDIQIFRKIILRI